MIGCVLCAGLLAVLVRVVIGVVLLEERLRGDLAEEKDTCVVAQAAGIRSASVADIAQRWTRDSLCVAVVRRLTFIDLVSARARKKS